MALAVHDATELRTAKIPPAQREKTYVVLLDLKKAFDSVKRLHVVEAIEEAKLSPYLANAAANLLSNTSMTHNGVTIKTTIGVPQGAVTSPTFFSLVINSLVE